MDGLKVKKDAAVTALFSLYKAAGDASSAVLDLINHLESTGLDVSDLRSAFTGGGAVAKKTETAVKSVADSLETSPKPASPIKSIPSPNNEEEPASEAGDPNAGKKRAKRAPRDPNAPKRPLNAFLKFRNQESKKISEERKKKGEPDLSRADLSAAVKERWDNLPESVREVMNQESKAELEHYHVIAAEYKESSAASNEPLTQLDSSQPVLSQPELSQSTQPVSEVSSPAKKKQKKKDDSKDEDGKKDKDDKEKKKKKKKQQQPSE